LVVIASAEVSSTWGRRMSKGHPTSQILINKKRGEAIPLNEWRIMNHEL